MTDVADQWGDRTYSDAVLEAVFRAAGRFRAFALGQLSPSDGVMARKPRQFVLFECSPFAARLVIVEGRENKVTPLERFPGASIPAEIRREMAEAVGTFLAAGMKEMAKKGRRGKGAAMAALALVTSEAADTAVMIDPRVGAARAVVVPRDGYLLRDEIELFRLQASPGDL